MTSPQTENLIVSDGLDGINTSKVQSNVNTIVKVSTANTAYYLNLLLVFTGTITIDSTASSFTAKRIA